MINENASEFEAPIGFKIDIGEIQDNQYTEEIYEEEPYVEESVEEPKEDVLTDTPKEEDTEKDIDNEDTDPLDNQYSDYTDSALIALSEIKDGTFEGLEEKDIPKDLDPIALRELYRKSKELTLKQEIERVSQAAGEASKYVEFLIKGGDPTAVKNALQYQDLLKLDIEDEENQRTLLKEDFKLKGIAPDEIDDFVDNIIDKGKGKEKAAQIKKSIEKYQDSVLEEHQKQEELRKAEEQRVYEETVSTVKTLIDKGDVNGIKISKKDQKELFEAIFSPTEVMEVVNPANGAKQKIRASKIQVLQQKLNDDPEKVVSFYHWLLKGGNFNFVKQQAAEEEQDSLRAILQNRSNNNSNSNKTQGKGSLDNLIKGLRGNR